MGLMAGPLNPPRPRGKTARRFRVSMARPSTVLIAQIEAAPEPHLVYQLRGRCPLKRDRGDLSLVAGLAQGADQSVGVRFGTAGHERGLGMAHEDPHQGFLAIRA